MHGRHSKRGWPSEDQLGWRTARPDAARQFVPALRFTGAPRTSVRIDVPDASKDTSSNCIANYNENVVLVICCTAIDGDHAPSPQGREIRGGASGSGSLGQGRFEEGVVAIGAEESFLPRRSATPIDVNGHRRVLLGSHAGWKVALPPAAPGRFFRADIFHGRNQLGLRRDQPRGFHLSTLQATGA